MKRNIDRYQQDYISELGFEKYQVKYRRKKIIEIITHYSPSTVLEIGCGMEPLFMYDDQRNYTIIEPGLTFFKNALDSAKTCRKKVKIYNAYMGGSTVIRLLDKNVDVHLEKEYDMIICSGLLQELENPDELLSGIRKLCNEKTIVHINVANKYSLHRLLAYESGIINSPGSFSERNRLLQQHYVFDLFDLKKLVEKNGFVVLDEGSFFLKPFSHDQMKKMIDNNIISEVVIDGLYNISKHFPKHGSEIYVNCCIK